VSLRYAIPIAIQDLFNILLPKHITRRYGIKAVKPREETMKNSLCMKLDNQVWFKITFKSPPNFGRRKKNQWDQNTNYSNVTNTVILMEE